MAENSKIEWTDHTFNPWVGCTKISPACDHCYAEGWAKRTGESALWKGERRRTSEANWRIPTKWNALASAAGIRFKVFCASLADVFDNQVPSQWRGDLFALIVATPNLDWLLLTKRPQNTRKMLPDDWGSGYKNVWLGTTVENRSEMLRRGRELCDVPANIRFWSCEPLLGPIGEIPNGMMPDWIIAGGESGPSARPMHPDWARSLRDQCAEAGVAFHFKQWGNWHPATQIMADGSQNLLRKGERPGEFYSWGADGWAVNVGKKAAGRLLDGVEHNGMPEARS